jgi:hypothetical protein
VLPSASDPVGVGYAQSLARPGGNVTGFTNFELSILGKSLEILKQIVPAVVRVALIYNPGEVEASNTPTIRRLTSLCRHQLSPIAPRQGRLRHVLCHIEYEDRALSRGDQRREANRFQESCAGRRVALTGWGCVAEARRARLKQQRSD